MEPVATNAPNPSASVPIERTPWGAALEMLRYRTFRSLRHRNYRLYFVGQLVSFIGSHMQSAAMMWLAYDYTRNPLWPPALLVAQVGPTVLFGPLGGSLADRLPKRSLVIGTQIAFMANAILLTILATLDVTQPWLLLALAMANGLVQAIDLPTRLAFVPNLVPRDDLINAVGLNSLLFNSARAIGPALAGICFLLAGQLAEGLPNWRPVALGATACFLLNAISFSAVLVALMRIDEPGRDPTDELSPPGTTWDGIRYLRDHRALAALVVLTGCFSTFAWPTMTLLPAYTDRVLGLSESAYSGLVSAIGAGALIAAITTATFGTIPRRVRFMITGVACGWTGLVGLTFPVSLPVAMVCCVALGFGLILYLSTGQSTMQLAVPNHLRGRVMALWAMTLSASAPIGHLAAGLAAQHYPVPVVLRTLALGVGCTGVGLILVVRSRHWKAAQ